MINWHSYKKPWLALLLGCVAGFFPVALLWANEPDVGSPTAENFQYWYDSSGRIEFAQAQTQLFQNLPQRSLSFGHSFGAAWLRLQLPVYDTGDPQRYWLELDSTLLSRWSVFIPGQNEPIYVGGLSIPRSDKDQHRLPVYAIEHRPHALGLWYIKLESHYAINLSPKLHSIAELSRKEKRESFLLGTYAGIMFFTYILTLYIYLRTRHLNFLYYSFLLLSFHILFVFSNNHTASLYIWPQSPWWSNRSPVFFGEMSHFFGALFVRDTLQTQRYFPRIDRLIRWIPLRCVFFIVWLMLDFSPTLILCSTLCSLFILFLYYGIGLSVWRLGYVPAGYFSIAWLPVLLGIFLTFAQDLNWWLAFSPEWHEAIRFDFPMVGAALQALLLGVAVSDQFRREQKEQKKEHLIREKLEQGLDDARSVQDAFIRPDSATERFEICSSHQMSAKIGGDWLGYHWDPQQKRLLLAISDVTGHGLPSALLTGALHGAFYGLVAAEPLQQLSGRQLLEVMMDRLDHVVRTTSQNTGLMATMALLCIDLETFHIEYLNAGHTPILISGRRGQHFLLKGGSPLGISNQPIFGHDFWQAEAGDLLFLFTDGLLDQSDTGQRNHLRAIARQIVPERDIKLIHSQIELLIHRNHMTLEDDSSYILCRLFAA